MQTSDIASGVTEVIRPVGIAEAAGTFVKIPDAQFLFHADFQRTGSDLTLTGEDGHRVVVPDYFKHEQLPTLLSPEGASITGDVIEALVGPQAPGQYAQAGNAPAPAPEVIGRVATASGAVTAVRNGVAVTLNVGDAVYKGDVIQTASDSAVGVVFTDNTTFNLSSNARMVLNEFVYTPGGSANSALINLVQGSIAFVAGEVAHTGDMKVGTPVATMGIRGTAVSVDISADNGKTTFSVMVEPNGRVGSFNLLDKATGALIGTVSNSSVGWVVSPAGPLQVLAQEFQKSADVMSRELLTVQQVFNVQSVGQAILQQTAPQQQQQQQNPSSGGGAPGSSTPPPTENKTDIGIIKITIGSVDKSAGDKPADAAAPPDTTHIFLPPPPTQVTTNPAPFFVGGAVLSRVPVSSSGPLNASDAVAPHVSGDGRYVAFFSLPKVPGGQGSDRLGGDVYLYDRQTETTTTIAHATGAGPNYTVYNGASISVDGRYVVYQASQANGQSSVYVYDRVSQASTQLHQGGNASIDGAGDLVVMEGQTALGSQGILVVDAVAANHAVLTDVSGKDASGNPVAVWSPQINGDGRLITFYTSAAKIVINSHEFSIPNANGQNQVYVYDRGHPDTAPQMVSTSSSGAAGDGSSGAIGSDGADWPAAISADGRYVVFQSDAKNLIPSDGAGDNNNASDIFVRDLLTGTTERVSVGEVHTGLYSGQAVFTANINLAGDQKDSAITSLADGGFLVTWDVAGAQGGVFAQRYDLHGDPVSGQITVNMAGLNAQAHPSAAGLENGGFAVTWTDASGHIQAELYSATGQPSRAIAVTTESATHASIIAASDGGFFVTWAGGSGSDIHAQRYDASGSAVGDQIVVNAATGSQVDPAITLLSDNGFVVAWTSPATLSGGAVTSVFAQRFDSDGTAVGGPFQVDTAHNANSQSHASITSLVGGGFVVAWTVAGLDGGDVFAQRYSAGGTALGIVKVNTTGIGDQTDASVTALQSGGYIVTWTGPSGNSTSVFAQAYDALGLPTGSETQISAGGSDSHVTTLPNGNFVVTWTSQGVNGTDISSQIFSDLKTIEALGGGSYRPSISPDGRYITFSSDATNLVSGDTNAVADTFIYDRVTQTIERVSADALGHQSLGDSNLGDTAAGGGSLVAFGGVTINGPGALQLQPDGHSIKFTAQISDLGGTDPITLTAKVGQGKLSGTSVSGLTVVDGLDGSGGILKVTGSLSAINSTISAGLLYTPSGGGNDALTLTFADNAGAVFSESVGFKPNGDEISPLALGTGTAVLQGSAINFSHVSLTSLDPVDHPVTLTLNVSHGALTVIADVALQNLFNAGQLAFVNGLDGSNGTLEVTGSLSAIKTALAVGASYIGQLGFTGDNLTVEVNDGYSRVTQTNQFDYQGHILGTSVEEGPGTVISDIYIVDRSAGSTGITLDDPAYVLSSNPTQPAVAPINASFTQSPGTQTIWIDQGRANPAISQTTTQQWGEVFTVPDNQSDLHSISLTISAPPKGSSGATYFELKLYEWDATGPVGPVLYDSGGIALGVNGAGIGPTQFSLPFDVAVASGKSYVLEIVGDGFIGLSTANASSAHNSTGALYVQSSTGNGWQPLSSSIFGEIDFQPALTTTGSLPFTDLKDSHSVSVQTDVTNWGHLTAYVSADTTGSNTAGEVTWSYEVDPSKAAALALGEQHFDTFELTLADSSGGTATTSVTVEVVGTNEIPKIISDSPAPPAQPISFVADSNVSGGLLTTASSTSGSLTFKEADLSDAHTVTATLTGAQWAGNGANSFSHGLTVDDLPPAAKSFLATALSASVASDSLWTGTGTINWSLASIPAYLAHFLDQGQTLTLTYTIEVDDPHLAKSTQTITVTIVHDAPAFVGWINNTGNGDWGAGANWSTGAPPTISDDVHLPDEKVLGGNGTYAISNVGAASAKSITLREGAVHLTNTGSMNVAEALTVHAGSGVSNSGTLNAASVTVDGASTVANNASGLMHVGSVILSDTGSVSNASGGQLTVDNSATLSNTSRFDNSGAAEIKTDLVLNNGSAVADHGLNSALTVDGAVKLHNTAAVANDGTLHVVGTVTLTEQSAIVNSATGQITIDGSAFFNDHASLDNSNIVEVKVDLVLNSSSTVANHGAASLTADRSLQMFSSSGLSNDGTLHVAGFTTLSDQSAITNNASGQFATDGATTFYGTSKLDNFGSVELKATAVLNDSASLANHAGGNLKIDGAATLNGASTIANDGALHMFGAAMLNQQSGIGNSATGGLTVDGLVTLNNAAALTNAGSAELTSNLILNNSSNAANQGLNSTLTVDGAVQLHNSSAVTNEGTFHVVGTATVDSATLTNHHTLMVGGTTVQAGGSLANDGAATLDSLTVMTAAEATSLSQLSNSGTVTVTHAVTADHGAIANTAGQLTAASAALTDASTLTNAAQMTVTGLVSASASTITNSATGELDAGSTTLSQAAVLTNAGTVHVSGNATVQSSSQFTNSATGTVTIDGTATVDSATLTNHHTLTVGGTTVQAGGSLANDGAATLDSLTVMTAAEATSLSQLSNSGAVTVTHAVTADHGAIANTAGQLTAASAALTDASTLTNAALLSVTGALTADASTITNAATGQFDAGSMALSQSAVLTNAGTVHVTGNAAVQSSSQFTNSSTGTVTIDGTATVDSATLTNHHTLTVGGTTVQAGGSLANDGAATLDSLTVMTAAEATSLSQLSNSGTVTVTHAVTADHGAIANTAGQLTAASAALTDASTLTNAAQMTVTGLVSASASTITNSVTGELDAGSMALSQTAVLTNAGTVHVTGNATVQSSSQFTNSSTGMVTIDGTATVDSATLTNHHTLTVGGTTVQAGGSLANDGAATLDSLTVTTAADATALSQLSNSGTVTVTHAVTADHGAIANTAGQLTAASAALTDASTLTNAALLSVTGALTADASTITNAATGEIDAGSSSLSQSAVLSNAGTVHVTGNAAVQSSSQFTNSSTGTVTINGTATVDSATLTNHHTLTVGGTTVQAGGSLTNDGTATLDSLTVMTAAEATSLSQLSNSGTVTVTHAVTADHGAIANTAGQLTAASATLSDASMLTNAAQVTVTGALTADASTITNTSTGEIDAGSTTLSQSAVLSNAGTVHVTGNAVVQSSSQLTNSSTGTVTIDGTATVDSATLTNHHTLTVGGTTVQAGGSLTNDGTATLDSLTVTTAADATALSQLSNSGTVTVTHAVTADHGAIANTAGQLTAASAALSDASMLTNAGTVHVTGNATLDQQSSISNSASGSLTVDGLATLNNASSLDNAGGAELKSDLILNSGSSITNHGLLSTLTVDGASQLHGASAITNDGAFHVVGAATLADQSTITNTAPGQFVIDGAAIFDDTSSLINTGTVEVKGVAILNNGSSVANGVGGHLTFDDASQMHGTSAISNDGALHLVGSATLSDQSTITNSAVGQLTIDGAATLNGTSNLANSHTAEIKLDLVLNNGSTITNYALGHLTIDGAATLNGTSAVTNNGTLHLASSVTLHNSSALTTTGAGAKLTVDGDVTVDTLGTFAATGGGDVVIKGAVNDAGTVKASGGSTIEVEGSTFNNTQVDDGIVLAGLNDAFIVESQGGLLTLTGGGEFAIGAGSLIDGTAGEALENVDNMIVGAGQIGQGNGNLTLTNDADGVIDATGTLTLNTGNTVVNAGLLEATAGGRLDIYDDVSNTGMIVASDPATFIHSSVHIHGAVTNFNLVEALDDGQLFVEGSILNSGRIDATGGALTVVSGGSIVGSGTIAGNVDNEGMIEAKGGLLTVTGDISGAGSAKIDHDSTLELGGSSAQAVAFNGANAVLRIDALTGFTGAIQNLAATDSLDLEAISYGLATSGTYLNGVLAITDDSDPDHPVTISLNMAGLDSDSIFAGFDDGTGKTLVTLKATDDGPVVDARDKLETASTISEADDNSAAEIQDTLYHQGGTIRFTDIDLTDRPTAKIQTQSATYTAADRSPLTLSDTQSNALKHALSLPAVLNVNNGAITWSYDIHDSALDFLAAGERVMLVSSILLDDHKGGTDTATVTVFITGTNDNPVITAEDLVGGVTEQTTAPSGNLTDSGTISFGDVDLTDVHLVSADGIPVGDGILGHLTATKVADTTGTGAGGQLSWTYTVADSAVEYLAAGQTKVESFTITLDDQNGGVIQKQIDVTVTGTNDKPVITAEDLIGGVTEQTTAPSGNLTDSGTISFGDVDLTDVHLVSADGIPVGEGTLGHLTATKVADTTGTGTGGQLSWIYTVADAAVEYLAAGQTKIESFTITLDDQNGGVIQKQIDVTVTGTNDKPIAVADAAAVTEDTNSVGQPNPVTGNVLTNDTDVDLIDTHSVAAVNGDAANVDADVAGTYGTLHLNADGSYSYTLDNSNPAVQALAEGQTVTDVFAYTDADDHGATSSANLTLTITGANDAPVAVADSATVKEDTNSSGQPNPVTGNVLTNDTDVDTNDTHSVTQVDGDAANVGSDVAGTYGTLHLNADGSYSYTLDDSKASVQALGEGQTVTDVFAYTNTDNNGATSSANLTVTVAGTNDAPILLAQQLNGAVVEDGVQLTKGQLTATDVDQGDTQTWTIVGGTRMAAPEYHFAIDDVRVTKTIAGVPDTVVFDDTFTGTAPPDGPNPLFGLIPQPIYLTSGSFDFGTDSANNGVAMLTSDNAVFQRLNGSGFVFGNIATANSDTQPVDVSTSGLKSGEAFSVGALFDLVAPDSGESYGIRLTDRATTGAGAQPGAQVLELGVFQDATTPGQADVELRQINFATGTSTVLAMLPVTSGSYDQIGLQLSNDPAQNGAITASFVMANDGVFDPNAGVSLGSGLIFQNGETWTRAQFFANAVAETSNAPTADSLLTGRYGTLDLTQSGTWTYSLNNGLAATQALKGTDVVHDTFTVQVADSSNAPSTQVIDVTVTGANDAPVLQLHRAGGTIAANEQTPVALAPGLTLTDVDSSTLQSAAVRITGNYRSGEDVLSFDDTSTIHGSFDTVTGTMTLTALGGQQPTDADFQAALRTVSYTDTSDTPSTAPRTVTFTVKDPDGVANGGHDTTVMTATINVTAVNDPPANTVPAQQHVDEDTDLAISGLSISDVDAGGNQNVTVALSVLHGTLSVGPVGGAMVQNTGSSSVLLTGSVAQIDAVLAALNNVLYRGGQDFNGSDTLTVTTADAGNTGSGGIKTAMSTVAITVDPVNDNPVIANIGGPVSLAEDSTLLVAAPNSQVTDVDGDSPLTLTLSVAHGSLTPTQSMLIGSLIGSGALTILDSDGSDGTLQVSGTPIAIGAVLHAGATYAPTHDYNGADALSIHVTDGHGGSADASIGITVTAVDDAPVNTVPGPQTVNEDTNLQVTGLSVSDVDAGNALITTTLSVAHGTLTVAPAGGAAVTGSGTGTVTLTGSQSEIDVTLWSETGVIYKGLHDFNGSDLLSVITDDGGHNGAGSATIGTNTVAITVTAVNDAPVAQSATVTATEGGGTVTGSVVATDVDSDASSLTFSLTGDAPAGLTFNSHGFYTFNPSDAAYDHLAVGETADVTATYKVSDGIADSNEATLAFTVTGTNDAPVAQSETAAATEGGGTVTGSVVATDIDDGASLTFSLTGDAPAGLTFNTDGTYSFDPSNAAYDHLHAGATVDVIASYTANDGTADSNEATLTITVTGTDDAPVAQSKTVTATEGGGTVTGSVVATDVDSDASSLTFSLTGDAPAGLTFNSHGFYTFNPSDAAYDHLAAGETVDVTATYKANDGTTDSDGATLTFTVTGTNDASVLDAATLTAVAEDTANPSGQTVADIFAGKFHDVDGSSAITGIAVIANDASADQGVWQYETSPDRGWEDVGTATPTEALAFSADTMLRFVPAHDFHGTPGSLTVFGLDDTYDTDDFTVGIAQLPSRYTIDTTEHGGSTPISAASVSLGTTITAVNDAPVAANITIENATPTGDGWSFDAANDHYYRLVANAGSSPASGDLGEGTWAEANTIATNDGAYLATITSQAEQDFIANLPGWDNVRIGAWTGGQTTTADPNDNGSVDPSAWFWITGPEAGQPFDYTHWNTGEPNGWPDQTTAYSEASGHDFGFDYWNDVPGLDNQRVVLEEWGGLASQVAFREDTATTISSSLLLAHASDVDGDNLTVTSVGDSDHHSVQGGTVTLSDGIVTYIPMSDFTGDDSFTYTVSDGHLSSTATVSFTVEEPELVANGGFESIVAAPGNEIDFNYDHWVFGGENVSTDAHPGDTLTHSGSQDAAIAGVAGDVTLGQDIATAAGQHYTLSFWVANDDSSHDYADHFSVSWNGIALANDGDFNGVTDTYSHYVFDVVGVAGQTELQFAAVNPPDYWHIDDVSVRASSGTTLNGTSGNDNIISSAANQTLTGNGGADNFVFNAGAIGQDTITDYKPGIDSLTFDRAVFGDVDAILAAITDHDGTGPAVITHGSDTVTLTGVTKQQLADHQSGLHLTGTSVQFET